MAGPSYDSMKAENIVEFSSEPEARVAGFIRSAVRTHEPLDGVGHRFRRLMRVLNQGCPISGQNLHHLIAQGL